MKIFGKDMMTRGFLRKAVFFFAAACLFCVAPSMTFALEPSIPAAPIEPQPAAVPETTLPEEEGAEDTTEPRPSGVPEAKTPPPAREEYLARYLHTIDGTATGTSFGNVTRLYYDRHRDEIYIIDNGNGRVVITGTDGTFLFQFSFIDAGIKTSPSAVAVDREGDIYVAEGTRVSVLNYRGMFKREMSLPVLPEKRSIQSIAIDDEGRIYIGMTRAMQVVDRNGKFLFDIKSGDGANFANVSKIAITSQYIYILDPAMFSVYRFGRDGKYISRFGKISGLEGGFSMPIDMGVDEKVGRVAVLDINRYAAIFYDMSGEFLYEFGGITAMPRPNAMAIGNSGEFFVVTGESKLVRAFKLVVKEAEPLPLILPLEPSVPPPAESTTSPGQ